MDLINKIEYDPINIYTHLKYFWCHTCKNTSSERVIKFKDERRRKCVNKFIDLNLFSLEAISITYFELSGCLRIVNEREKRGYIKEKIINYVRFPLFFTFHLISIIGFWYIRAYLICHRRRAECVCVRTRNCDNRKIIIDSFKAIVDNKKMYIYLLLFKEWRKTIIKNRLNGVCLFFVSPRHITIVHIYHSFT